jgi:hypothetical protein
MTANVYYYQITGNASKALRPSKVSLVALVDMSPAWGIYLKQARKKKNALESSMSYFDPLGSFQESIQHLCNQFASFCLSPHVLFVGLLLFAIFSPQLLLGAFGHAFLVPKCQCSLGRHNFDVIIMIQIDTRRYFITLFDLLFLLLLLRRRPGRR